MALSEERRKEIEEVFGDYFMSKESLVEAFLDLPEQIQKISATSGISEAELCEFCYEVLLCVPVEPR